MKTLVFAEKPSVGKDIARILGAARRGEGFLEGQDYVVTWGFGHLVSLGHPEIQNPAWQKWSLETLPMLPEDWKLSVLPSSRQQYENVAKLFNRDDIDQIINGADAGREGELIFRLVYQHCGCQKPIRRLWISSMTDEAIKHGFEDLRPGEKYDALAQAALCRSRADWLVGMNFTRAYTKRMNSMFTLGRVQTPTLAMVVNRHLEIQNFVPKDYWEVNAVFSDFSALWFNPEADEYPSRIDQSEKAKELANRLKGEVAAVHSVKKSKKKQSPPSLYDLTTLQREANSKYSMTAADTLATLQTLYEKRKVVTYPRTDSRYLSDDIFPTIEKRLASLPGQYDEYLGWLRKNRPTKDKRVFNDAKVSDHHAVIPTEKKVADTAGWPAEERNIYDMVVRRFLAVFYPDHEYLSTTVVMRCGKDNFKASGRVVTEEGWRALYPKRQQASEKAADKEADASAEDDDNEQSLPDLKKGDTRKIEDAVLLTRKTRPPAAYTEATLLQAMETAGKLVESEELRDAMKDSGLGTPATRAEIIEKLIRVEYMLREKKKLVPTPKGIKLVEVAAAEIKSPEMTGSWEKRLSDMARGKDDPEAFMGDIAAFVRAIVGQIKGARNLSTYSAPGQRPAADRSRVAREGANGDQRQRPPRSADAPATSSPSVVARKTFGECPACGKGQIIEGSRGFGCNRFKEGCNYVVWKEFYGKKLTQSAIDLLIQGRTTRLIKGFKLEDGRVVAGRLSMKEDRSGIELLLAKE
ncbi:MAG: DNA topoisomerase III [Candidatus Riflebacteria bacterium HGW-Riflebacteria-2]|jgi:DNA topoisomerase-3|nr:MAG: DNA topoisomerase III [Candidatus Riflebacteria bacterium HGW-Riflebacteria-2]